MTDKNLQDFIRDILSAHIDYDKFGKNLLDLKRVNLAAQELDRATADEIQKIEAHLQVHSV